MSSNFESIHRHVMRRLKDAGQDVANGKLLGKERCAIIAEAAVEEWRDANSHRLRRAQPDPWGES